MFSVFPSPLSLLSPRLFLVSILIVVVLLSGCRRNNEIIVSSGVGISATRTACPKAVIPLYTGDVTLFNPASQRTAEAVDIVATISNVEVRCRLGEGRIYSEARFEVTATRRDSGAARQAVLPYFASLVRGDDVIINKEITNIVLDFPAGESSTTAQSTAVTSVHQSDVRLPPDILAKLTRRRRAGNIDASIDPLSQPDVRAALARANYELLIGFQLSPEQFEYNVRR